MMQVVPNVLCSVAQRLTASRIRAHATLLAIGMWSVYAVNMATPGLRDRNGLIKGTDFLHFYTLGKIGLERRGDLLYSAHGQAAFAAQFVRGSAGTLFLPLYGPQVSIFFTWLALLPYGLALAVWLSLNTAIYFSCCYAIWRTCPALARAKWPVLAAAAAFPGFFHLLAWGQTSGLALLCFTGLYFALRAKRSVLAGILLGCLVFKPQLALASAVVFLFARYWKVALAAIASAFVQVALGWIFYGTKIMRDYLSALSRVSGLLPLLEPRLYQTHCLRTFWSMLVPWPPVALGLYLVSALGVLILTIRAWKGAASLAIRYSALLFSTILVSPHLTVYDLVILAPAFLFLADWNALHSTLPRAPVIKLLLYLCYPLFLLGPMARLTHIQLSVPVMVLVLWIAYRLAGSEEPAAKGAALGRRQQALSKA